MGDFQSLSVGSYIHTTEMYYAFSNTVVVIAELATFLALLLGFLAGTKPSHKWIRITPGTGLPAGGLQKLRRIVGSLQNDKWEVNSPKDLESQSDNSSFYDS